MRSRRERNPNKATTRVSISRPDTYERLPRTCEEINCEQQPVHTFGLGSDDDLFTEPLITEWMTPMMTPAHAERVRTPADLAHETLIHDDSIAFLKPPCNWDTWCKAAGLDIDTSHGPRFSQADHAQDAAMSGAGVVLARLSLATRALETGRLVAPFKIGIISDAQFRFVCPKGNQNRPHIKAFHDWMLDEIAASRQFEAGRTLIRASDLV